MSFENNIREWVTVDNKLRQYGTAIKGLREEKSQLTTYIITHVADNNMSHNTIQISDGILKFQNMKVTSPLTFKFITECLNDCISDEEQVKQLVKYIKQKREVKYVAEVKRSYLK